MDPRIPAMKPARSRSAFRLTLLTATTLLAACETPSRHASSSKPASTERSDAQSTQTSKPTPWTGTPDRIATGPTPRIIAESEYQWTGIAVSESGRLFVNYPRWSDRYRFAVAELIDGEARPYPDGRWNAWAEGDPWRDRFVAVQSVHIDRQDRLWVLDTGMVDEAAGRQACVYQIDLVTDRVVRVLPVPFRVAPEGSYLNDIRLTPDGRHAFISESGLGSIIILDVDLGTMRRTFDKSRAARGRADRTPVIDGQPWIDQTTGDPLVVHCDGIAVSPDGAWVHFQSISNDRHYRVPVEKMLSGGFPNTLTERLGRAPVTDGIIFDDAGNLYFSALEENAIIYTTPQGEWVTLAQSPDLKWPDSFAIHRPTNTLYFTTAQIHLTPPYAINGTLPQDPFRLWAIPMPD